MKRAGTRRPAGDEPIERYLASLRHWSARRERSDLVAEARRHLFDATRRAERAGMPRQAALRAAIRAFGPAWRIGLRSRASAARDAVAPRPGWWRSAPLLGPKAGWGRPAFIRRWLRPLERRA